MSATTFIDLRGHNRDCSFTMGEVLNLKPYVNLLDLDSIIDAASDAEKFLRVVYLLTKAEGEPFETFAQGFNGQTLDDAQAAFWQAVENFTPRNRMELVRQLIAKIKGTEAELITQAIDELTKGEFSKSPERSE